MENKKKVLIFIVAYNAEKFLGSTLDRIPASLWNQETYQTEVLVIDDASKDQTVVVAKDYALTHNRPVTVMSNPVNQGYGGNQKIGYYYAIEQGVDIVVLLHGDGQYAPEMLEELIAPLAKDEADVVFGSRMLKKRDALKGGMPHYKFIGNIILTKLQNFLLGSSLAEFHTGYRLYKVDALKKIPFSYNSNDFDFDTDIIIQLIHNKFIIKEIPIPTHYGEEVCHVNGVKYAFDILCSTFLAQVQRFGIYYAPKFDYTPDVPLYRKKIGYPSSHTAVIQAAHPGQTVLDICYGEGYIATELKAKGCTVYGCYETITEEAIVACEKCIPLDLHSFDYDFKEINRKVDVVIIGDTIGRFDDQNKLLLSLKKNLYNEHQRVVITTGNIGFILKRIGLLFGQFNYSRIGTTDFACKRLFTFTSIKHTIENAGFRVEEMRGVPVPFPLIFGDNMLSKVLLWLNMQLIKLWKGCFSYQIVVEATAEPPLTVLLERAQKNVQDKMR